ncbi:DUF58 domain-containing protein [Neptunicella marina]|uniref:DUF58 domain-containing protein n=1 Tax=Neptunicella marina TaxID=2125989 RepID=A0A8J6IRA7_9ALTE|nr:DUF58 domain-containing protein [Neptunicella marina]MBC3764352.1 DUF58 domain-containing protein [Neptunicella marina]
MKIFKNGRFFSNHWLNKRIPRQDEITLSHRHIFILPSRFGASYVGLCILLFVMATNFQNNLMLLLCYFLVGIFLLSLFRCYQNFVGLTLRIQSASPVFVGETVTIPLLIKAESTLGQIKMSINNQTAVFVNAGNSNITTAAKMLATYRGQTQCPRIKIESFYPLGLFHCWSMIASDQPLLVYPAPVKCPIPAADVTTLKQGETQSAPTQDKEEYYQLRPHQTGEPLHHIAWKQMAMGRGTLTKQFSGYSSQNIRLIVPNELTGLALEKHLSELTFIILILSQQQQPFSLQLGDKFFDADNTEWHSKVCLKALATWKQNDGI